MSFAELVAASNYSFLHGASHPAEMVARAHRLGLAAIGIADRNTVAGVVRAHVALRKLHEDAAEQGLPAPDLRLVVGARLVFSDTTPDIIAHPATRKGWGQLTRLLTVGNMRAVKGDCILYLEDLLGHCEDLLLIILPDSSASEQQAHSAPLIFDVEENQGEKKEAEAQIASSPERGGGPSAGWWRGHADTEQPQATAPIRHVAPPPPRATPAPPPPLGEEANDNVSCNAETSGHPGTPLNTTLTRLSQAAPDRLWLGVTMAHHGDDARRLLRLRALAAEHNIPLLSTNDALYADAGDRPLQDVLTAIRHGLPVAEAGFRLAANAERHLKSPEEMARLFAKTPEAITASLDLLSRIHFTLDDLRYEYPHEPVPAGWSPLGWLHHMVKRAAYARYGTPLPAKVRKILAEEFWVIRKQKIAAYFLTVHDLVHFARTQEPPILCQGRGSAANSIVCFLLGVTSVDPLQHDLLFSRFVSEERREPPDIDVDFEHERREEVMQYVYRRYGRHRAGIAATVIHYRQRSVIREVGKALGFSEDVTARMSATIWGSWGAKDMPDTRIAQAGFDTRNPAMLRFKSLVDQLLNAPRHLSQHVGGFVLTENRLDETVPLHHAAMADRSFIEWDKDDIDALGLMKVDILALGMLTCIRKSFDLMRQHGLGNHSLEVDLDSNDRAVYDMLEKGDSIGTFQVESRAQISMLPRLRPANLYDLTVQVAIVRPGPIEGGMVHPYLRRRNGEEPAELPSPKAPYPPDELQSVLGLTFGVPIFQEQAMKLAIVAAGFTPSEANKLRRAMATFRNVGTIENFRDPMINGMVARGYDPAFATRCFDQIKGFGSYGFPESHALSFARLAYVSSWLKCHHPAVFTCALLNSQPMGFYAPAQLVRDAQEHGVTVRPVDINHSDWDNSLERMENGALALRLGFRRIDGFHRDWAEAIMAERAQHGAFASIEECARRCDIDRRALRLTAEGDGMGSMALTRRNALWSARRSVKGTLPLFEAAGISDQGAEADMALPAMPAAEEVAVDYQTLRLSLKGHPLQFLRGLLQQEGLMTCAEVSAARNDAWVKTAGLVLVRQRPGNGKAIFITLEDETGITNALLWERLFHRYRRPVMAARLMQIEGQVQRSKENVVHLMARRIIDRSDVLNHLFEDNPEDTPPRPRAGHPRNVRLIPKSRDFH